MDIYAESILEHYRHPQKKSPLTDPTVEHEEVNLSCGDSLKMQLVIENGIVGDIGWDGTGCAISQAAMSMLGGELIGKSPADLDALKAQHIYDLLGVQIGPRRVKCALLALHTLKNAVRKMAGEELQSWSETLAAGEKRN